METPRQVVLFNGEPVIRVTKKYGGGFVWATKAHGMMSHSLKKEVFNYMRRHGYKCFFVDERENPRLVSE